MKKMEQVRMIVRLAKNDFKAKYSASALGTLWAFVQPLATVLVFWYVFQAGFKTPPVNDMPYILWFIVGYVPWIYFSDILSCGVNVFSDYSFLVKKVRFQIEYLPLVRVISSLFVHLFFLIFLLFMFWYYQFDLSIECVQILYYSFAITVFGWGLIMLLGSLSCFFSDIAQIVPVILQVGFWATPVFWNPDTTINRSVRQILSMNPMYYIVDGCRRSFLYHDYFWNHPLRTAYFWLVTLSVCCIGVIAFQRLRPHFADEL